MSSCNFCQNQDDVGDMKIYKACEISDGKPCGPCTEYLEVEAQIEQTRKALEQQLQRRRMIRKKINRLHDAMLIRVPPEITAYIFELAASVDIPPDGSTAPLEGELYAPLPLGQVCGAWRNIAWDMPQLWNFMFARIRSVEDLPLRLDIARQWLSRSGEHSPLSIHFRLHETPDDPEDPFWNCEEYIPFIELLNLYSQRWKDLCGLAPSWLFEELSANGQGAPMLQYLQLSITDMSDEMTFDLGCEPLPKPHSVHYNDFFLPDFHIDWSHVTQLKTNSMLIDLLLNLLPQLHQLKDLSIHGVDVRNDHQSRSVTHLGLRSLDIQCTGYNQRSQTLILFNSLILPSLLHLKIDLLQDRNVLRTVLTLIRRSSCTLSSLSLSGCPPDSDDSLIHLFECTNLIQELEISGLKQHDRNFLAALLSHIRQRDNSESQALPLSNLQSLSFIPDGPHSIPWKELLLIFDPNWTSNLPQWKTLSIRPLPSTCDLDSESQEIVHESLPEEVLRRLLQLVEAGIELFLPRKMSRDDIHDVVKVMEDAHARDAAFMDEIQADLAQLQRQLAEE